MERDEGGQEMKKIMNMGFPHHGWMREWMKPNWPRTFIISSLPSFLPSFSYGRQRDVLWKFPIQGDDKPSLDDSHLLWWCWWAFLIMDEWMNETYLAKDSLIIIIYHLSSSSPSSSSSIIIIYHHHFPSSFSTSMTKPFLLLKGKFLWKFSIQWDDKSSLDDSHLWWWCCCWWGFLHHGWMSET